METETEGGWIIRRDRRADGGVSILLVSRGRYRYATEIRREGRPGGKQ